jgi:hypothetical protein
VLTDSDGPADDGEQRSFGRNHIAEQIDLAPAKSEQHENVTSQSKSPRNENANAMGVVSQYGLNNLGKRDVSVGGMLANYLRKPTRRRVVCNSPGSGESLAANQFFGRRR